MNNNRLPWWVLPLAILAVLALNAGWFLVLWLMEQFGVN
jgi:hypothetical protein